jgi:tetratricopeptide (TPR) repeat protein
MTPRLSVPGTKSGWLRLLVVLLLLGAIAAGVYLIALDRMGERAQHLAEESYREFRYEDADSAIQQSLRWRPRSWKAQLLAARLARLQNRREDAEEHLRLCKTFLTGTNETVEFEVLLQRAAWGEVNEVFPSLMPYIVKQRPEDSPRPEAPLVYEALTAGLMANSDLLRAMETVNSWIELQPDNPWAYLQKGKILASALNMDDAADQFKEGLERGPWIHELHSRLAEALLNRNNPRDARKHLEWLNEQTPDNPDTLLLLTNCYRELNHLKEAEATLDKLLELKPENADAQFERGMLEQARGHRTEAIEAFRQCLEVNRYHPQAYFNLAACYRSLGQSVEADASLKRYDQLNRDIRRGEEIVSRDLQNARGNPELYYELGLIYQRLGKPTLAARTFLHVVRLNPAHRKAHEQLADYFDRIGDAERARYHRSGARG